MIIGICAKMGSGKDYIANNYIIPILKKYNREYIKLSFADQLKVLVMQKYNINYNDVYIQKTKHTRSLLQQEGCSFRSTNPNAWIDYHQAWSTVLAQNNPDVFIITSDVRYQNEFDYIQKNGGLLIKINAKSRNEDRINQEKLSIEQINHHSECDLDNIPESEFDLVIDNEPGTDLTRLNDEIIKLLQL